ncbi:MAG: hypothetical protein ACTSXG_04030 [Alphaproteobacteria bacterium]
MFFKIIIILSLFLTNFYAVCAMEQSSESDKFKQKVSHLLNNYTAFSESLHQTLEELNVSEQHNPGVQQTYHVNKGTLLIEQQTKEQLIQELWGCNTHIDYKKFLMRLLEERANLMDQRRYDMLQTQQSYQ